MLICVRKNYRIPLTIMPRKTVAATAADESFDFEQSLAELEAIVNRMEQGEQSLQDSMRDFERGMKLAEACRRRLATAQQRVEKLVKKHEGYELQPLQPDEPDAADDREAGGN